MTAELAFAAFGLLVAGVFALLICIVIGGAR
jgi:hypothetical protein